MNKETWEKRFDIFASKLGLSGEQMDEMRNFIRQEISKVGYDEKNSTTTGVNFLHRFLDKFNFDVKDNGRFYDVEFKNKKTGEKVSVPIKYNNK